QGHEVVDLHLGGGPLAALEVDALARVRILEHAGEHDAAVAGDHLGQVPGEDVVAGVAAVVVEVELPRAAELLHAVVVDVTGRFDPHLLERYPSLGGREVGQGGVPALRAGRGGGCGVLRRVGVVVPTPTGEPHDEREHGE